MKNLTDFRKTVETGVDPRLMILLTMRTEGKRHCIYLFCIYLKQIAEYVHGSVIQTLAISYDGTRLVSLCDGDNIDVLVSLIIVLINNSK